MSTSTSTEDFGAESFTEADRAYAGSRFAEVRQAIFANPYQQIWGGPGGAPLPMQQVTLSSVLRGALTFGKDYIFRQATARAVDSHADLRWGEVCGDILFRPDPNANPRGSRRRARWPA